MNLVSDHEGITYSLEIKDLLKFTVLQNSISLCLCVCVFEDTITVKISLILKYHVLLSFKIFFNLITFWKMQAYFLKLRNMGASLH